MSSPTPRLGASDRLLPIFILAAMVFGLGLSRYAPASAELLSSMEVGGVSLPIAVGLIVMMYPPLVKVRLDKARLIARDRRLMVLSLALNWVVGPFVMFALAWVFLADEPALRTGLIIVGLARCIAMVLVWTDLSCADRDATAVLVAVNSVFQLVMFSVLGWFYLKVLPGWLGLPTQEADFAFWDIARSVLVFLGIPLVLAIATRVVSERVKGRRWFESEFIPQVSPLSKIGLLYTIVTLFCLQGQTVLDNPWSVARLLPPLVLYFVLMFFGSLFAARGVGMDYAVSTSTAFTAAGNNFELAIAVTIGTFGAASPQALTGTVGPLVEIPVLVALVYVALALGPRLFPGDPSLPGNAARA